MGEVWPYGGGMALWGKIWPHLVGVGGGGLACL